MNSKLKEHVVAALGYMWAPLTVVASILVSYSSISAPVDSPKSYQVKIDDFRFSPKSVEVESGTSVQWLNTDRFIHSIQVDGLGGSKALENGQDFTLIFSSPGEYNYHCGEHKGMRGVIRVVGDTAGTPARPPENALASSDKAHATPDDGSAGNTIQIVDFMTFSPAKISVPVGETVVWENHDGSNHIIAFDGEQSPRIRHGGSFSKTFDSPGEYRFICAIHGERMSGSVTVTQ